MASTHAQALTEAAQKLLGGTPGETTELTPVDIRNNTFFGVGRVAIATETGVIIGVGFAPHGDRLPTEMPKFDGNVIAMGHVAGSIGNLRVDPVFDAIEPRRASGVALPQQTITVGQPLQFVPRFTDGFESDSAETMVRQLAGSPVTGIWTVRTDTGAPFRIT